MVGVTVAVLIVAVLVPGLVRKASSALRDVPLVVGAVPYWDRENALETIRRCPRCVDVASPWSYSVAADGSVTPPPHLTVADDASLATWLRQNDIDMVPSIANTTDGSWDHATVAAVLHDPGLRRRHVDAVTRLVADHGFAGIQIDYEGLTPADGPDFSAFVTALGAALHGIGRVLYVTVHPRADDAGYGPQSRSHDYAEIARAADRVVLMAYDWHWETSPPGPIAPYDWVRSVVQYTITQIPREKVVLGVALYGYDWVGSAATPLTWSDATALAAAHGARIDWDDASRTSHFTYTADGAPHEVWFEDGRSVDAKLSLAQQFQLGGIAFWRLGGEDPSIWRHAP